MLRVETTPASQLLLIVFKDSKQIIAGNFRMGFYFLKWDCFEIQPAYPETRLHHVTHQLFVQHPTPPKQLSPHWKKKPKQATPTKVWFQIDFISISTNQWVEIKACNYKLHIWLIRTGHAWSLSWMPHSLFSFLEEDPGSLSLFRLYIGQSPSYLMCGLGARVSILGILTHLHEWAHSTREKMETYSTSRMEKQPWCGYVTILSLAMEWLILLGLLGQGGESLQALCLP